MATPIFMASLKDEAPIGRFINSCIASLLPACEPLLITLKAGTGNTKVLFPARYGYCKNLKKTVKTGQTRTRERKST
ncbi:hypothetical protein Tco_0544064 [Tanacetum coccineum]